MNNDGPLRSTRPSGIRGSGANRSEPESPAFKRAVSTPESSKPEPVAPAVKGRREKRERGAMKVPNKLIVSIIVVIVILVVIGLGVWSVPKLLGGSASTIDSSKYQAVQLINGQFYFGKLSVVNGDYFKLSNAYYIQAKAATTDDTSDSNDNCANQLVSTNNADCNLATAQDMVIPKSQVLLYENLTDSGKVAQLLKQANN